MKRKGFTLVELLVVVVVIITLMSIIFRLSSLAGDAGAHRTTVERLQRLENCIAGYYAAFGSYPPVSLHRQRSIFYEVDTYGNQLTDKGQSSSVSYAQVQAACEAQPVGAAYPFPDSSGGGGGWHEYIDTVSTALTKMHFMEGPAFKDYRDNPALANHFSGLGSSDDTGPLKSKQNQSGAYTWNDYQVFKFGLLSFLLPRYLLMMQCANNDLYDFLQWCNNNQMPARFEDGERYNSWAEVQNDVANNPWKIETLPSQAVTARWMPNLEKTLSSGLGTGELLFFGVDVQSPDMRIDISTDNPTPKLYTMDGNGAQSSSRQYALCNVDCYDGWNITYYYYSPAPYQTYRLWSAGPNGKTFPPWISEDEIANDSRLQSSQTEIGKWIADDIVHMSN